jgi:hypothetical protein
VLIEIALRRRVVGAEAFPDDRVPALDLIWAAAILSDGKQTLLDVRRDVVNGLDETSQSNRLRHGWDEWKVLVVRPVWPRARSKS